MSVEDLLQKFQNTPRLFQLTDRLSFSQPQHIYLKNLQEKLPQSEEAEEAKTETETEAAAA